ncbi:MAG: hypothetical protein WKG07_02340 [Hymenobacter sp.]
MTISAVLNTFAVPATNLKILNHAASQPTQSRPPAVLLGQHARPHHAPGTLLDT